MPKFLLMGDTHLRDIQPATRTDDFQKAQLTKLKFIKDLVRFENLTPLHAGDVFNHWKPSPQLINLAIRELPEILACPGNHDLPNHNIDRLNESGFGVLNLVDQIIFLQIPLISDNVMVMFIPWDGTLMNFPTDPEATKKILIIHTMVHSTKTKLWPGAESISAKKLLQTYPDFDLIVTGHNHQSFSMQHEGRWLVNPGCMTRQKINEEEYRPAVFIWDSETNKLTKKELPLENKTPFDHKLKTKPSKVFQMDTEVNAEEARGHLFKSMRIFFINHMVRLSIRARINKSLEGEN